MQSKKALALLKQACANQGPPASPGLAEDFPLHPHAIPGLQLTSQKTSQSSPQARPSMRAYSPKPEASSKGFPTPPTMDTIAHSPRTPSRAGRRKHRQEIKRGLNGRRRRQRRVVRWAAGIMTSIQPLPINPQVFEARFPLIKCTIINDPSGSFLSRTMPGSLGPPWDLVDGKAHSGPADASTHPMPTGTPKEFGGSVVAA